MSETCVAHDDMEIDDNVLAVDRSLVAEHSEGISETRASSITASMNRREPRGDQPTSAMRALHEPCGKPPMPRMRLAHSACSLFNLVSALLTEIQNARP